MDYMTVKEVPTTGYVRMYQEKNRVDLLGIVHHDIHFGEICEKKEDLPGFHEYDVTVYKYLGIAKINIEPID